ncbi:MAG: type II toxin-antitoxin system RelE/ParE family toxin [Flavobacteriales bacterium]|jgi:hypothetical protein|nr:type II toxin-antitoxin system RelE/ParE family toxin [Flavobacteriales bacterium]
MPKLFRLSVKAINDLQNVFKYTLENWGAEQAKKYTLFIESSFEQIGINDFFVKELNISSKNRILNIIFTSLKNTELF